MLERIRQVDSFGYRVEMHYKGNAMYQTLVGALVTVTVYVLILINSLSIFSAFVNNENQTEVTRKLNVDMADLGEEFLGEN